MNYDRYFLKYRRNFYSFFCIVMIFWILYGFLVFFFSFFALVFYLFKNPEFVEISTLGNNTLLPPLGRLKDEPARASFACPIARSIPFWRLSSVSKFFKKVLLKSWFCSKEVHLSMFFVSSSIALETNCSELVGSAELIKETQMRINTYVDFINKVYSFVFLAVEMSEKWIKKRG